MTTRLVVLLTVSAAPAAAQPFLSRLAASAGDPIFATYAAPLERSSFIVDEGYRFLFYENEKGIRFSTDHSGEMGLLVRRGDQIVETLSDLHEQPEISKSYSDLVMYTYRPFPDMRIDAVFQVYSSSLAVHDLKISNEGAAGASLSLYPFVAHPKSLSDLSVDSAMQTIAFRHREELDRWMVARRDQIPYVPERIDVLHLSEPADAAGAYSSYMGFIEDARRGNLDGSFSASDTGLVAFQLDVGLRPGEQKSLRIIRGVAGMWSSHDDLAGEAASLLKVDTDQAVRENEAAYARIPRLEFRDNDRAIMYWSAFNLMRQLMMPPEGKASYNYYVYSREPTWGWGYAGQVFHESITMLAYAFMDPAGARTSQRVYMERQWADGYVPYRVGPYLDESIFTNGEFTASAPWFNWENWEIYQVEPDREFLEDAYRSGTKLYDWWVRNRDDDGDGLAEWGGHAVLESIRDSEAAVWDEVGWPNLFESPDLNAMLVNEAHSLAKMARELGFDVEAAEWQRKADERAARVRTVFWDEEDGFFYHLDKRDNDFTYAAADDLKRQEIVGFFPMWAGIATREQAERLVEVLTDTSKFWKPYGIPSLAADDPYYNPKGYWNGPVWVELNYLIFRALLDYGYIEIARELAERIFRTVIHHLEKDHTFWEFYSPDDLWAGYHQTYIWTAIVARMLIDLENSG